MINNNEFVILITEDDDGHAELIKEGLLSSGVCNPMLRFCNGEEVLNYLNGVCDTFKMEEDTLYLMLLDINMPKIGGIEVLSNIKSNPKFKNITVIMLTTTDDPREMEICYELGCNMYVTKPIHFDIFANTLHRMGLFMQIIKK